MVLQSRSRGTLPAIALAALSCKAAPGTFSSMCTEGIAAGASDAGPHDGGDAGLHDAGDAGLHDAGDAGEHDAGNCGVTEPDGSPAYCASCQCPASCGTVENPAIGAVVGLAASKIHAPAFYVLNRPPDVARFFAVGDTGADLGAYDVTGVANLAWESLAVGPCPGGSCVFLADIGDAAEVRGQYAIYRVREPATLSAAGAQLTPDVLPFAYPDGSHDAAAILVHPVTGVITILTRDHTGTGTGTLVYELPTALPGQPVTATPRGSLPHLGPNEAVTAGSARSDARAVLLRTTTGVLVFDVPASDAGPTPLAEAFRSPACTAPSLARNEGEAIGWLRSGSGYLSTDTGPAAALRYTFCTLP